MALVYIVEDDTDIREMETYALKSAGLSVDAFANSEAFFEMLSERLPDLVILDIMLPGADDYLIKPFGIMELVSRCKALLRRSNRLMTVLAYETIEMDDERHRVTADGQDVELTFKEYSLLKYLLENCGTTVTRERLMEAVWGFAFTGETRTVDMHIKTLRKKLGASGALILTVRNVGYQLGR